MSAVASSPETATADEDERLFAALRAAIARAPGGVREIEIGVALSIALGKRRPAVACGGCATPLEFEGIPARTNARLRAPFRLIGADAPNEPDSPRGG